MQNAVIQNTIAISVAVAFFYTVARSTKEQIKLEGIIQG